MNMPPPPPSAPPPPPPLRPGGDPIKNSGKAVASMVCGIVGLMVFGIILGVVAIVLSTRAKKEIQQSAGQLKGQGMATAGLILGIVDIAAFFVIFAALN
jgi:hypothetical protein